MWLFVLETEIVDSNNFRYLFRVAEPEPESVGTVFIWGLHWNTVPVTRNGINKQKKFY